MSDGPHSAPRTRAPVTASSLISRYALQPHPEGGFYARTYSCPHALSASASSSLPVSFTQFPRPLATAIVYLLTAASPQSALHCLPQDEHWMHLAGRPVRLVELSDAGPHVTVIGSVMDGHEPSYVVPGDRWFGAISEAGEGAAGTAGGEDEDEEGRFSFCACIVYGSFFFEEFSMGERGRLLQGFPACRDVIERLSHKG